MNILEVTNVSKTYAQHQALKQVSIAIPQGSIFGLLGPNGAGKTSLIRIVTQITRQDEGSVFFEGQALNASHIPLIGYLPEERGLYKKMQVGEQLLYFAQLKGLSKPEAMHKLKDWIERFEIKSWWSKKVEELSKGMQQKIQFIATVLHQPKLIILDEPFSGFDPINANLITDEILRLKREGTSIIFSTHRMESVEQLCDYIALIHQSEKILDGSVNEVRERYRTHTYEVEHSHASFNTSSLFELQSTELKGNKQLSVIKLQSAQTTNDVLHELLAQTIVFRFEEKLPTMQEIFIEAVQSKSKSSSA